MNTATRKQANGKATAPRAAMACARAAALETPHRQPASASAAG
ncbi:hypothetical protein [Pseudomonas sp. Hp2]|nr:hypothetical protein [Pseudomonas sp. Hp2]